MPFHTRTLLHICGNTMMNGNQCENLVWPEFFFSHQAHTLLTAAQDLDCLLWGLANTLNECSAQKSSGFCQIACKFGEHDPPVKPVLLTTLQTIYQMLSIHNSRCKQQGTKKGYLIPYLHLEAYILPHQCPLQLHAPTGFQPHSFMYLFQSACNLISTTTYDSTGTELFKSPPEKKEKLDQMVWEVVC